MGYLWSYHSGSGQNGMNVQHLRAGWSHLLLLSY